MWILRDAGTVLRAGADGATAAIDLDATDPFDDPCTHLDPGWGVRAHGQDRRLAARRPATARSARATSSLPPGPFELLDCEPADLAATPDGRLVVADYGCGRLVTTRPDGKVTDARARPG